MWLWSRVVCEAFNGAGEPCPTSCCRPFPCAPRLFGLLGLSCSVLRCWWAANSPCCCPCGPVAPWGCSVWFSQFPCSPRTLTILAFHLRNSVLRAEMHWELSLTPTSWVWWGLWEWMSAVWVLGSPKFLGISSVCWSGAMANNSAKQSPSHIMFQCISFAMALSEALCNEHGSLEHALVWCGDALFCSPVQDILIGRPRLRAVGAWALLLYWLSSGLYLEIKRFFRNNESFLRPR